MAGFIIGAVLTVALLVASGFRNAFAAIKQHPRSWKERTVSLQIGGIKATFAEHALDVSRGGREQQFVRILRNVLNASEAAELLALAKSHPTFAEETFGNPVRSPCQVLANDNQWNTGDLADMVRTVVEERVLPYMKLVLKCHTLVASQVLVRHYHKEGRQSFSPHTDHSAFRTAVIDLTPLDKSGLFVLCGNGQDVKDASEFAFFVPLQSGDAAVHKWDVWHGVALKEGHERVSLIVWVQPAVDNDSGVCSWYLEAAVAGNAEAAYHLGIEAWRQRLLGQSKVRLLEEAQRSLRSGAFAALQQLGGKAQAEAWHWKCCKACQASAVGRSETLLRLKDLAQTQARGVLLQDLGRGMFGGKGRKRHSAEMRKAFGRGWNEAQTELPESVFEQEWTKDTGAKWTTQTLAACTFDLERAQRILERAGLAIFEDPRDRLQRVALQECQQEFQNYFSEIMVELKHRGLWPSQELDLDSECKEWFQFNEVCSRSPGRYDIQLPSESEAWAGLALEQLPWKSLVQRFLGEDAQESRKLARWASQASNLAPTYF
eukprot:g6660.t1